MLKTRKGQPFYKDFWFWVKILIFVVFLLFLVYPFYTLVVNSFYFCDADGKTDRVQSREKQPVDETTPEIGSVRFERVQADGCKACVAYAMGLPEKPMEHLELRDCSFTFDPEAKPMVPAMALGVEACARRGIIAKFIRKLTVHNLRTEGMEGALLDTQDVGEIAES